MGERLDVNGAIILARKHVCAHKCEMQSSAELCLADAVKLYGDGDIPAAARRALDSLRYTVGVTHTDYKRVLAFNEKRGY